MAAIEFHFAWLAGDFCNYLLFYVLLIGYSLNILMDEVNL